MFRNINVGISREGISVPEVGIRMPVSEFIQSRGLHADLGRFASRVGVVIHLAPDSCASRVVSMWGVSWPVWAPDPLLYFPILDALDRAGIRVSSVTLAGKRPYRVAVLVAWIAAMLVVVGTGVGLVYVAHQRRLQQSISGRLVFETGQIEDNKRYIRQVNDLVWNRCFELIQGVRMVQGVLVMAEIEPERTQLQFVVADGQADAAVSWVKPIATDVGVDAVADGWVLVYAK